MKRTRTALSIGTASKRTRAKATPCVSSPTQKVKKMTVKKIAMREVEARIKPAQAWEILGVKKTKFYALCKTEPSFPKIYKDGTSSFLKLSEVLAYQEAFFNGEKA